MTPPTSSPSIKRRAVPASTPTSRIAAQPELKLQDTPVNRISFSEADPARRQSEVAEINVSSWESNGEVSRSETAESNGVRAPEAGRMVETQTSFPIRTKPIGAQILVTDEHTHSRGSSGSYPRIEEEDETVVQEEGENFTQAETLQYHAFDDSHKKHMHRISQMTTGSSSSGGGHRPDSQNLSIPRTSGARPTSTSTLGSELRGRNAAQLHPNGSESGSPHGYPRESSSRRSPVRPVSYIDLLNNVPHNQQVAPGSGRNNLSLQHQVGNAASLLDTKKTLEMYRANVKKTNDAAVQYEFAILMVNTAKDATPQSGINPTELIGEAKQILQRLSDRAYPFAQYYLGDGFFSGLFNKEKPDHDKAFQLFISASKHGHAEAGYRAALCYEFGWGTATSYPKAVQFFRNASAKNHPGAATRLGLACIRGDMGLGRSNYREGVKWLKRAQESADYQYNAAPYELGLLHLTGYGADIFKDEAYAAQLFTQSAELGHVQANYLMGQAYEEGKLGCPRDAALSVHFYNGAAAKGHVEACMALCAWFMVGAEPVLERDEGEAYAWAKQAAELGMRPYALTKHSRVRLLTVSTGFPKAEYALGYFTEMGIGCRRDPLEANVWYVRAADNGNETAKQRLQIIRAAAAGTSDPSAATPMAKGEAKTKELKKNGKGGKFMGIF